MELQRNFVWMEDVFITGKIHPSYCKIANISDTYLVLYGKFKNGMKKSKTFWPAQAGKWNPDFEKFVGKILTNFFKLGQFKNTADYDSRYKNLALSSNHKTYM